jgi:hypothetical protein
MVTPSPYNQWRIEVIDPLSNLPESLLAQRRGTTREYPLVPTPPDHGPSLLPGDVLKDRKYWRRLPHESKPVYAAGNGYDDTQPEPTPVAGGMNLTWEMDVPPPNQATHALQGVWVSLEARHMYTMTIEVTVAGGSPAIPWRATVGWNAASEWVHTASGVSHQATIRWIAPVSGVYVFGVEVAADNAFEAGILNTATHTVVEMGIWDHTDPTVQWAVDSTHSARSDERSGSWDPAGWGHDTSSGVFAIEIWRNLRVSFSVTDPDEVSFTIPSSHPVAKQFVPYASDVAIFRNYDLVTRCRVTRVRHVVDGMAGSHDIEITAIGYKALFGAQVLHKSDMDDEYVEGLGLLSEVPNSRIIEYAKESDKPSPSDQSKMPKKGKIGHVLEDDTWYKVVTKQVTKTVAGKKKKKKKVTEKHWESLGQSVPSTGKETRGKQSKVFRNLVNKVLNRPAFQSRLNTPLITFDSSVDAANGQIRGFPRLKVNGRRLDPKRVFDGSLGMTFLDALEEVGSREKGFEWWIEPDVANKGWYGGLKIMGECPRRQRDRRNTVSFSLGAEILTYEEVNEDYFSFVQGIAALGKKRKTDKAREREVKNLGVRGSWEKSIRFSNSDDDEGEEGVDTASELKERTKTALGFHSNRAPVVRTKIMAEAWWTAKMEVGDTISIHLNRHNMYPALPEGRSVRVVEVTFNVNAEAEEPIDMTVESEYTDKKGRLSPPPGWLRGGRFGPRTEIVPLTGEAEQTVLYEDPLPGATNPPLLRTFPASVQKADRTIPFAEQPKYEPNAITPLEYETIAVGDSWDMFWSNLEGATITPMPTPDPDGLLRIQCRNNGVVYPVSTAVRLIQSAAIPVIPGDRVTIDMKGYASDAFTLQLWLFYGSTPDGASPYGATKDPVTGADMYQSIIGKGDFRVMTHIVSTLDPDLDPEVDDDLSVEIYGEPQPFTVPPGCYFVRMLYAVAPTHTYMTDVVIEKAALLPYVEGLWDSISPDAVPYTRGNVLKVDPAKAFGQAIRSVNSETY